MKMFKDRGLWDDALRLARHYRPDAMPDLERQRQAQKLSSQPSGASVDSMIQKAKLLERQVSCSSTLLALCLLVFITRDQAATPGWKVNC